MSAHLVALAPLAKAASPLINWGGLFKVTLLALATGVIIVGGFSLGLAALDVYVWSLRKREDAGERVAHLTAAGGTATASAPSVRYASLAVAVLFFAICVVGLVYGLIEMLSK